MALQVKQESTTALRKFYADDPQILAWMFSEVEVVSALCRLAREGSISRRDLVEAISRFESFYASLTVVSHFEAVKPRAKRLLRVHPLKAADALQLGAALAAVYDDPSGWEMVCLDERLRDAASHEGFLLLPR